MRGRVAALMLAVVLTPAAHGAEAPPGLTIADDKTKIDLDFTAAKAGQTLPRTAPVVFVVRNQTGAAGTLRVQFLRPDSAAGKPLDVVAKPKSANRLEVVWKDGVGPPSIDAQGAVPVRLEFRLPAGLKPAAAKGKLLVRLPDAPSVGSALVSVAPKAPESVRFQQTEVTMRVTVWCRPRWLFREVLDEGDCLEDERLALGASRGAFDPKQTVLSGDRGESLTLALERGSEAALHVDRVVGAGTYSGQLVLDPDAEKPQTLEVTVKVRHALFPPLLVVAAGIVVAFLIRFWQSVGRGRRILRARLVDVVRPYLKRRMPPDGTPPVRPLTADEQQRSQMYQPLADQLRELGQDQFPTEGDCVGLPTVPALSCEISKARSSDRLIELEKQIADVETFFNRRMQVFAAFDALSTAATGLPQGELASDAEAVMDLATNELVTDEEAAAIATRMRLQALITLLYREADRVYRELSEKHQKKLGSLRPDRLYASAGSAVSRKPEELVALRLRFVGALRSLRDPENAPPAPVSTPPAVVTEAVAGQGVTVAESLVSASEADRRLAADIVSAELPEPEEIRAGVERVDWLVFLVSAALAALLYLLPEYKDETYGTPEDYLIAFAAGAAGTVAINWLLAPFARSYTRLEEQPQALTAK